MNRLLVIVCLEMFVFSCSPIHKCNSNDIMEHTNKVANSLLNETEGKYLNRIFETSRKDFDFINKKIGFLTGSSGTIQSSKEHYFDMQEQHSTNENSPCDNGTLYIFNASQKGELGGYDAAIVYWSKFLIPVEKVVKSLKEKH
ncbi:MAG TPA: hypothetical protein VFD00_00255 [Thermoclostridium sp.]|nr:hypothetical protein [Thermoclostridium sp.]